MTVFFLACTVFGLAQPKLWGDLKKESEVGFKSFWTADPTRTFHHPSLDGPRPPRPILVNVWYPAERAEGPPMTEGDYLQIGQPNDRFAAALAKKNLETVTQDVGKATTDAYLHFETAAHRDAPPVPGKFPVVVYISGYGSSFQDNCTLCEYLASHGYIVIGSAYQRDDLFQIAGRDVVTSDIRWLIQEARKMPNVDIAKVAVAGHSGGAQSSMAYASQVGSIVDAVVSLDTTQDYYFSSKAVFKSYLADVDPKTFSVPVLVCADSPAVFDFVDSLTKSDRTYLIVDDLWHDEYTSDGLAEAYLTKKERVQFVRERYTGLCQTILTFLDAKLKGSSKVLTAPKHFTVEQAPAGVAGPKPYTGCATPPTPRQFRIILETSPEKALKLIERFQKVKASLNKGQLAYAVLDYLLEKGDVKMARRFLKVYLRTKDNKGLGAPLYIQWGQIYRKSNPQEAIRSYEKALQLDPGNKVAKAKLAQLKAGR